MSAAGKTCANCAHAASVQMPGAAAVVMVCRRFPPVPILAQAINPPDLKHREAWISSSVTGYQAPTTPETTCGEWFPMPGSVASGAVQPKVKPS